MKIETSSVQPSVAGAQPASRSTGAAAPEAAAANTAEGKGVVDISSAARHLASLQNGDNDIDVERVNALRDAIASGQLKINAGRIADAVVASARELLK